MFTVIQAYLGSKLKKRMFSRESKITLCTFVDQKIDSFVVFMHDNISQQKRSIAQFLYDN